MRNHNDHLVTQKLKTNKAITSTEINSLESILFNGKAVGTKQDYIDTYGDQALGEFIREIVGSGANAAQNVFDDFIEAGALSADQMMFIKNIINCLTKNEFFDKGMLFEPRSLSFIKTSLEVCLTTLML